MMKSLIIFYGFLAVAFGRQGFGPGEQEWGHVTVREGAHIFWWLYYTTATNTPTERPLIIWLQGGPGSSSTQYGNFEELGPLDSNLNFRNYTWVNYTNVMFVDNPVGTGFSYVDSNEFTVTNKQIAEDFVVLMQGFYKDFPEFEDVPLYIFSESYGGKITAEIALHLNQAIQNGTIKSNFKGVGLGDSWISPIDSCLTWAPYLYTLGFLDTEQYNKLNDEALKLKSLVDTEQWHAATQAWIKLQGSVKRYANNVDFYNILTASDVFSKRTFQKPGDAPSISDEWELMNGQVKPALNLTNDWGTQDGLVFGYLMVDFMKPVTAIVERLLNETDLTVAVYNGQLDLIVDTLGTIDWVDRLNFKASEKWSTAEKQKFSMNGTYEGFEKHAGNLVFYWILRSGHMVPKDNPNAMLYILEQVTNNFKV